MNVDQLLALARKHNAKVCDVPYDGVTFTRSQLVRFVEDIRAPRTAPPDWSGQCRQCAHLRRQFGGCIWKCAASGGFCADARAPNGICGHSGKLFKAAPRRP